MKEQQEELEFSDEINCMDLFGNRDERERILIFAMGQEMRYKK